ncbi:MAG: plasmid recombination protein [Clostridia bacterium]|nr:plasmid recombination protein [Clostridia bacterium]
MPYTIATHVGTKIARQHNIRDKRITDKEAHIDPNGKHEVWLNCNLTEKEAYHKLFDSAVAEYNSRQKRNDRKIFDYYEKIKNDKQKHTAYEMIVSVGNMEERIPEELSYEILTEFVEGWKEKNPNMYMFGCYYHADEQGVPHVHIDYIPVGTNYTRGMKKQVSSSKALEEMGFVTDTFKGTAQVKWIHSENERLETICNNHGVEVYHPQTGKEHLEKDLYILEKQADNLRTEISDIEEEKQNIIRKSVMAVDKLESEKSALEDEITELVHDKTIAQAELDETAALVKTIRGDFEKEIPKVSSILPQPEKKETAADYRKRIIPIISNAIKSIVDKARSWHRTIIALTKENTRLAEENKTVAEKDEKIKTLEKENSSMRTSLTDIIEMRGGKDKLADELYEYRERRRLETIQKHKTKSRYSPER